MCNKEQMVQHGSWYGWQSGDTKAAQMEKE